MKITFFDNHTKIWIYLTKYGNDMAVSYNAIYDLCKKHNAQFMLSTKTSHLVFDKVTNIIGFQTGIITGSIVFHSHSCQHKIVYTEMVTLLESLGLNIQLQEREVIKTHRSDGSPYKTPQHFIESVE